MSAPARERARRPWVCVSHAAFEGPGVWADTAAAHGVKLATVWTHRGDAVPHVTDVAGVIVLGGPFSATEADAVGHLRDEVRLLRDAVRAGLPTMGVCLG
ncbi:MAG TPA: hypothetical protein VIL49_06490, partial [Capillimicrobium sp.]